MTTEELSVGEIGERGERVYETSIRPLVERENAGRYVVLDIETGAYALGDDLLELSRRMREAHPTADLYSVRVGSDYTARIGRSKAAAT